MERSKLYRLIGGLALAQFASLLITLTGLTSSVLSRQGINVPTSQSLCNYGLLALVYGSIFIYRRRPMQVRWFYYLLLALIDVEGNYFVVKAYQYTSLTSVMLLDCWTIPCVLLLTWLFIKTRYNIGQLVGVCCCILGLVLVILSDVHAGDRSRGSNPALGDSLVIIGATLYALANVSEEFLIKKVDLIELMAFLGLFGSIVSACQVAILERRELASTVWTTNAILPFLGFGITLFLFYSIVPFILKFNGATLLNLSLLTSDMWAVIIRIFVYHQVVDWLFFIAFAVVAIGLVIYSASGKYIIVNGTSMRLISRKVMGLRVTNVDLHQSIDGEDNPHSSNCVEELSRTSNVGEMRQPVPIGVEQHPQASNVGGEHPLRLAAVENTNKIDL